MKTEELQILFEDKDLVVCIKPHGVATQSRQFGTPDMESLLKNHIYAQNNSAGTPYLAVIHRLDQPVLGILAFAKTPFAAKELNKQLQTNGFGKYYRALITGTLPNTCGTLENYLVQNRQTNASRVCEKNVAGSKLARLHYKIVDKGEGYFNWGRGLFKKPPSPTEVQIQLDTGRHHQIRVQLAHIGCPIIGDTKYNKCVPSEGWQTLMLCAYKLSFRHPRTKEDLTFTLPNEDCDN